MNGVFECDVIRIDAGSDVEVLAYVVVCLVAVLECDVDDFGRVTLSSNCLSEVRTNLAQVNVVELVVETVDKAA